MALITVAGGRDSNSFVTAEEALVLINNLPDDTTDWLALNESQQEFRLRLAADAMNYLSFHGRKIYVGQALVFPRSGFGPKNIPLEAKEAQVFIAYSVIHRALANRGLVGIESGGTLRSFSLGGVISVSMGDSLQKKGLLDSITDSTQFVATLLLSKYITQFRGRSIPGDDNEGIPVLSTTTTMSTTSSSSTTSSTISTTSSSTTTTTTTTTSP